MVDDVVVVVDDADKNEADDLKMKEFQLVKFFETSRRKNLLLMLNVVS